MTLKQLYFNSPRFIEPFGNFLTHYLAFFCEPFGYSFEALLISEKNKSVDREASEIEFS